jgi:hypothetical protein
MTYTEEISLALIRVLEHASFHKDVRLAGFAANADFWADEVRHALDCIAGYEKRFQALRDARTEMASRLHAEIDPSWITPTITAPELNQLKQRVLVAATRFFRLCNEHAHLDRSKTVEIETLLGIHIQDYRVAD